MYEITRYVMPYINSNMYVIADGSDALIIDPVRSEESVNYLKKHDIKNVLIILTHQHFDHTNGAPDILKEFPNAKLMCHVNTAADIALEKNNSSVILTVMAATNEHLEIIEYAHSFHKYSLKTDYQVEDRYSFLWQGREISIHHTPGHSTGSICIEFDNKYVFTGDSLIPDTAVVTKLPGGSKSDYNSITVPYLNSLSNDYIVMPGHGMECKLGDLSFLNFQ